MPRISYGPTVKARSHHLLGALLAHANCDDATEQPGFSFTWLESDKAQPKLRIETKLRFLQPLTQDESYPDGLTKSQISEALRRMEDYLEILEDNRMKTQGKEAWRFTLTLWSKQPQENLKQFEQEWERRRPAQSRRVLGEHKSQADAIDFEQVALVYNDRGVDFYKTDWVPEALSDFEEAVRQYPTLPEAHYNLGCMYEQILDYDRARNEYREAMLRGLPAAYSNMARLSIKLDQDYTGAVELLQKGLKLVGENDSDPKMRYALLKNLGWARLAQTRYAEAKEALQTAIALNPERASAHCLLAQVLEAEGNSTHAQTEWELCQNHADDDHPDEDTWNGLAQQRLTNLSRPL